jgi:hypothetical protein
LECKNGGQYGEIFRATQGLCLFGTPHGGMEVSKLLKMIENESGRNTPNRAAFVKQLGVSSWYLAEHREDIIGLWNSTSKIEILSFYETNKTASMIKVF